MHPTRRSTFTVRARRTPSTRPDTSTPAATSTRDVTTTRRVSASALLFPPNAASYTTRARWRRAGSGSVAVNEPSAPTVAVAVRPSTLRPGSTASIVTSFPARPARATPVTTTRETLAADVEHLHRRARALLRRDGT